MKACRCVYCSTPVLPLYGIGIEIEWLYYCNRKCYDEWRRELDRLRQYETEVWDDMPIHERSPP